MWSGRGHRAEGRIGLDLNGQGQSQQRQSAGLATEPALPTLQVCPSGSGDLKFMFPVAREERTEPLGKAISFSLGPINPEDGYFHLN